MSKKQNPLVDLQDKLDNKDRERALKTSITVIMDESGSMWSTAGDVIGGFNALVEEQKAVPGEARLSLVTFNNTFKTVLEEQALDKISELTSESYTPGGGTALLDTMGETISALKARFESTPKSGKPDKVIVVIMTDGAENGSRIWKREQVFDLITAQRALDWEFMFIGANQDAISAGQSLGVAAGASMNYVTGSIGTQAAYSNMSKSITRSRTGVGTIGATDSNVDINWNAKQTTTTGKTDAEVAANVETYKNQLKTILGK
jgi:Mg-chelatase subunit ChlD